MKGISDFLAKFKVIPDPRNEKKIIIEIISTEIKQELPESCVEVKGSIIQIDVHPAIKNLIFQRRIEILEKLNKRFNGEKIFSHIY